MTPLYAAVGHYFAPFIIFKNAPIKNREALEVWKDAKYNYSKSGWMNSFLFLDWLQRVLKPETDAIKARLGFDGPIVLIVDGHGSHKTWQVIEFCKNNKIELICLPPNTTHLLQVLDVKVFGTVKPKWAKLVKNHYDDKQMCDKTKRVQWGIGETISFFDNRACHQWFCRDWNCSFLP